MVVEGVFPALVRPQNTLIRCRVAVLASGIDWHTFVDMRMPNPKEFPNRVLVGSVKIVDCVKVPHSKISSELKNRFGAEFAKFYPKHYVPKNDPVYLWVLDSPRSRKRPVPINQDVNRVWTPVPKSWIY
jgi:hypothetical protein